MEEKFLLVSSGEGRVSPNNKDPFPEVFFTPDLKGAHGRMVEDLEDVRIHEAERKKLCSSFHLSLFYGVFKVG